MEFERVNKKEPRTLLELNQWVAEVYPPEIPQFNPLKHPVEVDGYNLQLFGEMAVYDLARSGASVNNPSRHPHTPRNTVTAKRYIALHSDILGPLEQYMANPLLSTLGPSIMSRGRFHGYSITVPKLNGDLVAKSTLFEHNQLSMSFVSNSTLVGRCAICQGLLVLPDFVTYLAFFWPKDLKPENVTPAIRETWAAQSISVCWVHFLSDGKFIAGRKL